jgi:hypothetical protein
MKTLRTYEPPKITSLTSEEVLDLMGPAQAMGSEEFGTGMDQPGSVGAGGGSRRKVTAS